MIVYKWHDGKEQLVPPWFQQGLWYEPRQLPVKLIETMFDGWYESLSWMKEKDFSNAKRRRVKLFAKGVRKHREA